MRGGRLGPRVPPALALALALALLPARPALAAVSWENQADVGPDYVWNYGSSLATSADGSTAYLHTQFDTDYVDGAFATDDGPHEGVYYLRSSDGGATWTAPRRLNPPERHADRGALAAEGSHVYVVWVSQASYDHYDPSERRVVFFRSNDAYGAGGAWGPTRRLSSKNGRVDLPAVAAAGDRVYVTWVDAKTAAVRVATSPDGGATWTTQTVGFTRATDPTGEGRYGYPSVGAGGTNVGVAWIANKRGTVRARISTDGGTTWEAEETLAATGGNANHGSPSVDGLEDRLAFAWTTPSGVFARAWQAGTWGTTATVAAFDGGTYVGGYDPAVALEGMAGMGIAWSDCKTAGCDTGSAAARIELSWSESDDNGATWSPREQVRGSQSPDQRINDGASVAWDGPDTRYVLYNGWAANYIAYDLFLKVGTGS
ncbi:MAG: exo-alpha-sialidase, partial [Actinobacteria bacterium]|nr:exo-alpha-sialidase [Actinomycetota bacterium]